MRYSRAGGGCIPTVTRTSGTTVPEQRSIKHKHFWHQRGISAAICRAKAYLAQRSAKRRNFWTTQPCRPDPAQPYINHEQQGERTSGLHIRVNQSCISPQRKHIWRSRISTAISKAKANLAPDRISAAISTAKAHLAPRSAKRKPFWTTQQSGMSTAISIAKAHVASRSAKRKRFWTTTQSGISTATSTAKAHLAP